MLTRRDMLKALAAFCAVPLVHEESWLNAPAEDYLSIPLYADGTGPKRIFARGCGSKTIPLSGIEDSLCIDYGFNVSGGRHNTLTLIGQRFVDPIYCGYGGMTWAATWGREFPVDNSLAISVQQDEPAEWCVWMTLQPKTKELTS